MITLRHGLWAWAAAMLGGCGNQQSALDPKGPEAYQLAQLACLLFAFGTVVLLLVMFAILLAIRGGTGTRALLAAPGTVVWCGVVFPAVTLTALLACGVWLTRASIGSSGDADAVHIEVVGEQWWWRVAYRQSDGPPIATANEIRIPVGKPIVFTLRSADVIHSFWVPNLGGKVDMIPGRANRLSFTAERPGIYRGVCAEFCGDQHARMAFEVVAVPPHEFDAWLQEQGRPAAEATSEAARRGRDIFLGAGCGACHTVRGTSAAGVLGPDLTHLGARRSVGVDTLAATQANIARFISEGQHIKPGNLMPPFRIFPAGDLDAVAAYLAGLR